MEPQFQFNAVATTLTKIPEFIEHMENNKIPMGQKHMEERQKESDKILLPYGAGDSIPLKEFTYVGLAFNATISFIMSSEYMYWKTPVIFTCMEVGGLNPDKCLDIFQKIGRKLDKRCCTDINECISIREKFGRDSKELEDQLNSSLIQAPGYLLQTRTEIVNGISTEVETSKRQMIIANGAVLEKNSTEEMDFFKDKVDLAEADITRRQNSQDIYKLYWERANKRKEQD